MPPKKNTNPSRVQKTGGSPNAGSSNAGSSRARLSNIMTHDNFLLLWLCYETSEHKPDYQTIADRLGISRHAAHQRFYTLRNYFKSLDGNNNAGAAGSGGPSSSATQRTTRSSQSGPVRTTTGATAEKESVDLTGEHQEGSSVKDDDYYDSDEDDEEDDYEY